jgi:protein subunit release factor B
MKKELLFSLHKNDFIVQTFRAGGKGGQKQNKTSSGVRIIHPASNARGECREERSQPMNKKIAFKRLTETDRFKLWVKMRVAEITTGETTEQWVERMMLPENLKIELVEV